ncbi:MAG TPA: hypothetical protein PKO23_18865, partial [Candidatus Hydrogenedentes bacterium]|nr:hypothetical protein [Candidatus Hydrogenedentota bacterium]
NPHPPVVFRYALAAMLIAGVLAFKAFSSIYGFPDIPGVTPRPHTIVPEPNTMRNGIHLRAEPMYVKNRVKIGGRS